MALTVKTIVWDVDDVLNNITRAWFETAWLPIHPECLLAYEDLTLNPPHDLLSVTREEYLESLDRFRLSPQAALLKPDGDVLEWFRAHGGRFRHVALTARPRNTVAPVLQWLLMHFGEWFQTFSYVPAERPGQSSRQPDSSKADYLEWLGHADVFIDDNPENCLSAQHMGILTFLRAQPWNRSSLGLNDILSRLVDRPGPT